MNNPQSQTIEPLTNEEQREIAGMTSLEKSLFMDFLLANHTSGPDCYDGWTRFEFEAALFSGPQAWRDAFEYATKRRSE